MIQLDLFTWRPKYISSSKEDSLLKRSTPEQRMRANRRAINTVIAKGFIRERFGK